ncbi:hypothetical protein DLNHIDIE_01195 [Acidithiobacillus thiooxidans ATCC 19377]|uniref:Uncharacterized protein n=1 Tax=Acidithiobacillus thiooxidans ATCC 19377 TaxID=637390 RepID=A0A543Q4R8_ACITH|nr:hypothetical protein DLNHIDIE_01195 [Acidithiobacillus thiooxidans ATCC 19377]
MSIFSDYFLREAGADAGPGSFAATLGRALEQQARDVGAKSFPARHRLQIWLVKSL